MGSCSSVNRNSNSVVAKFNLSKTETNQLHEHNTNKHSVVPPKPSPADDVDAPKSIIYYKSELVSPMSSFRSFGSKEENFFDTRSYMDSDCDDFYSVNGDFTPSRGSTPVHPTLLGPPPPVLSSLNRPPSDDSAPSPTAKKNKKLVDLFRDSIRVVLDDNNNNNNNKDKLQPPTAKQLNDSSLQENHTTSPLKSIPSDNKTPIVDERETGEEDDDEVAAGHCCFSRLVSLKKSSTTPPSSTPSHIAPQPVPV